MGTVEFFQIVVFMSLAIPQFPANSQYLLAQILSIICFDMIDPSLTTGRIFDFEDDYRRARENKNSLLIDRLKDLEIETSNSILNIGGLFNVILIMVSKIILILAIKLILKTIENFKPGLKNAGERQL
jgi:hypothetical protein